MKTSLLLLFLFFFSMFGFSQYKKGDLAVTMGSGLGIYNLKSTENPSLFSNQIQIAVLFNMSLNYTLSKKLTFGFDFERKGFLAYRFSKSFYNDYGVSYDYKMDIMYHIVNLEKTRISIELGLGVSSFKLGEVHRSSNSYPVYHRSNGFIFEPGVKFHHYFWKNLGMFASANFVNYNYSKLFNENEILWKVENSTIPVKLILTGVNFRSGLLYQF